MSTGIRKSEIADGKPDLLCLSPDELAGFVRKIGQKPFRSSQLRSWIFAKAERDFSRMTNLSDEFRRSLAAQARVGAGEVEAVTRSADGRTAKYLFRFDDGARVEAVSMLAALGGPERDRHTVCLSTQVGCAMGCAFCATGTLGFQRDLTSGEMLLQAVEMSRREGRITNVVFMGMGEPLLNLENTLKAVEALADPHRFGLGTRKITISTCGIVPGIEALARAPVAVRLALSLNSPFQEERARLMPIARRHPLERVLEACDGYASQTGKRVTVEYVLLRGVNTGRAHARELARIAQRLDGKVNLIEYNAVTGPVDVAQGRPGPFDFAHGPEPVEGQRPPSRFAARSGGMSRIRFESPQSRETLKFREWLEADGASVTIRFRRGREIAAGCGQLVAKCAVSDIKEHVRKDTDERKRY